MDGLPNDLARFQDGCLAVVVGIIIFCLGFAIGYAVGRAWGMF